VYYFPEGVQIFAHQKELAKCDHSICDKAAEPEIGRMDFLPVYRSYLEDIFKKHNNALVHTPEEKGKVVSMPQPDKSHDKK